MHRTLSRVLIGHLLVGVLLLPFPTDARSSAGMPGAHGSKHSSWTGSSTSISIRKKSGKKKWTSKHSRRHGTKSHSHRKSKSSTHTAPTHKRSKASRDAFTKKYPCPSTGTTSGACPGYVVDHVTPLKRGGADDPSNMQWQTKEAASVKDTWE